MEGLTRYQALSCALKHRLESKPKSTLPDLRFSLIKCLGTAHGLLVFTGLGQSCPTLGIVPEV